MENNIENNRLIAGYTLRNCGECGKKHQADNRNLNRGWGLCCSKRCAAKKREKSRPDYNPATVAENNERRLNWNRCEPDYEDNFFSNEDSFQFGRD